MFKLFKKKEKNTPIKEKTQSAPPIPFSPPSKEQVLDDLRKLNHLIDSYNVRFDGEAERIYASELKFGSQEGNCAYFTYDIYTEKGNEKKYPFILRFDINRNGRLETCGKLFYQKDKTLGKCHISSEDYYNGDFIVFYTKGFEVNKIVRNGEVILKKKV